LERVSDGVLADDRRSAMSELRVRAAESAQAQAALGVMGLPVLLTVLREEREDLEMIRGALETLYNCITAETVPTANDTASPPSAAAANAQALARDRDALALLLSLLEEEDFYVRYHTTQLLTELVRSAPKGCERPPSSPPRRRMLWMDTRPS
jgi:hypothetical protein